MISGLAAIADMNEPCRHVAFVPIPEVIDLRRVAGLTESSHCRLLDTRTKGQISLLETTGQS
jgi:hypothetical protein